MVECFRCRLSSRWYCWCCV